MKSIKKELILGSWTRTESTPNGRKGVSVDTFKDDGSKLISVTVFEGAQVKTVSITSQWEIDGNKLIETITSISEDEHQLAGAYNIGDVLVSKIKKLELSKLVVFSAKTRVNYLYQRKH